MSFKYSNIKCDHCGEFFSEQDDIVICPVCGAPHHRECYLKNNACSHECEHASGYEWKAPVIETASEDEVTKVCTRCGARNRLDAESCQLCGMPLTLENVYRRDFEESEDLDEEDEVFEFDVDGVSSKEMEAYLGSSSYRFMPKFLSILQNRGGFTTWSIPAFFLGPFYFFYRRIDKIGMALLGLLAVIYVPNIIYTLEYFKAYYVPELFGVTVEYSRQILTTFKPILSMAELMRMALHVYCCVQANRLFLDKVITDIQDMHVKYPADDRNQGYLKALSYRGKPATTRAVLIFVSMLTLLYVVVFLLLIPIMKKIPF